MRVVHVVPRIADISSGPSISVPSLCKGIASTQSDPTFDVKLMTLTPRPEVLIHEDLEQFPTLPFGKRLGVSPGLRKALHQSAKTSQIMHNHSLWMMPNVYPYAATRNTNCRLVVSPRGTASEYALSLSKWKKRLVWFLGQKNALLKADCIHATCQAELEEVRAMGYEGPIAILPNGITCPKAIEQPSVPNRTILFLARIHRKKGVEVLLKTWAEIEQEFPDWNLQIAGPVENAYARSMQQLAQELQLKRVEFAGELLGEQKSTAFFDAELYVLPTHNENFGISVAESLAHGTPAIVFEGAPWQGLNERDAGWWIPPGQESLRSTMKQAMAMPSEALMQKGLAGRQWMLDEFDWNGIGRSMASVYRWLCDDGDRPPCVHLK